MVTSNSLLGNDINSNEQPQTTRRVTKGDMTNCMNYGFFMERSSTYEFFQDR